MDRDITVMTGYNYGELTDDLLVETLLRLPVKSLMRFRCVSKSWFSLVKNHNFISKHLSRQNHKRLIVYIGYFKGNEPVDDFLLVPDKTLTDTHFQNLESEMRDHIPCGPCEGIFCFSKNWNQHPINLWNVSMNECRILPEPPRPRDGVSSLPSNTSIFCTNFAIGLDPITNDFKMVMIQTLHDEREIPWINDCVPIVKVDCLPIVKVFNFSTNSWRDVEEGLFPLGYYLGRYGIKNAYQNGFCYWVQSEDETTCDYVSILSFSMSEEAFQEMKGPPVPQLTGGFWSEFWTIGIHDDCLSLLHIEEPRHSFGLWMMKGGFWTKQLTFGPFIERYQPIGFWGNGEFILESHPSIGDRRVVLYDSKYEQIRDLGLPGLWFSVHFLKESLIPVRK